MDRPEVVRPILERLDYMEKSDRHRFVLLEISLIGTGLTCMIAGVISFFS